MFIVENWTFKIIKILSIFPLSKTKFIFWHISSQCSVCAYMCMFLNILGVILYLTWYMVFFSHLALKSASFRVKSFINVIFNMATVECMCPNLYVRHVLKNIFRISVHKIDFIFRIILLG